MKYANCQNSRESDQGYSEGQKKAGRVTQAWGVLREKQDSFREEEGENIN